MNLKLFYFPFDFSLTVRQTTTCRGSSVLLKFQSSSCCLVQVCLFSLFCVVMPILVGENYGQFETTASLLGFPTCRPINRFLLRKLCHVEVWCLLMFFRLDLTLLPATMFCWCHWWEKFSKHVKLLPPLLHSPQINLYRELCNVEVQCLILLLNWNWARNCGNFKED